jgi:hypothetical protein
MISLDNYTYLADQDCYPVMIDGRHAGYVEQKLANDMVAALKNYKIVGESIPK